MLCSRWEVIRRVVTEVLGTVRRYYVAGPTCCFGGPLLQTLVRHFRLLNVANFAVEERHFHVFVHVNRLRTHIDILSGWSSAACT